MGQHRGPGPAAPTGPRQGRGNVTCHRPLPTASAPLIVALSGGIGAGKSSLAHELAKLGAEVVSADAIAASIYTPGSALTTTIIEHFGPTVATPSGGIDRPALGRIIFADANARQWLNAHTHPQIRATAMAALRRVTAPIAIYDVPLLIESEAWREADVTVVVTAPTATRIGRITARDGIDTAAAQARIDAQRAQSELLRYAHIEVRNDGSSSDLAKAAQVVARLLHSCLEPRRQGGQ